MKKVYWMTGLSGSGKTSISKIIEEKLSSSIELIDGDILRKGLCENLGFNKEDRNENSRRAAPLTKHLIK